MDKLTVTAVIEAEDQLGLLLRRITIESLHAGDLRKQAHAIVEQIDYLGGELKVIEVDGVSNAVQIRSRKPTEEGYVEIVLRAGNYLSFEKKGAPLHLSKALYERLLADFKSLLSRPQLKEE